jgi:hypothetical protein
VQAATTRPLIDGAPYRSVDAVPVRFLDVVQLQHECTTVSALRASIISIVL